MKEAGCLFISLGFESANDRVLKIMKKRTTFADHMRNMNQAREAGLTIFGNFMFGHETETAEEIKETFDFLNQYDLINGPANGLATVITYPGTGYYRNAEKKGLIDDPFKFLLSYSMKAGISSVDIREKDAASILNISSLSNDELFGVVCTENIKHRRLYSKRHAAVDVERTFLLGQDAGFVFKGKCPTCGSLINFTSEAYHNPLNISKLCESCYYTAMLDIYQFSEIKTYLENLKVQIEDSNKIVIYGGWIMDLIFCGSISLPYEKIVAWVDPENPDVSNYNYVYHIPQRSMAALKSLDYDSIIALKPRALATPLIIEEGGLNPDATIISIVPDVLNAPLLETITGKFVAIAGESDTAIKVKKFLETRQPDTTVENYITLGDINSVDVKYDFVIYDQDEIDVDRQEFAENSRYLLNQVLYTEFLLEGGYYANVD